MFASLKAIGIEQIDVHRGPLTWSAPARQCRQVSTRQASRKAVTSSASVSGAMRYGTDSETRSAMPV